MSAASVEEMEKHIRIYLIIGGSLLFLTLVTVGVSYLHLPTMQAILLALGIAMVKGSLVAAVFMHLKWEKLIIYWTMGFSVFLFLALMAGPSLTHFEVPWAASVETAPLMQPESH